MDAPLLPSQILEQALAANRKMGWVPRGPSKHFADARHGTACCFLVAMCRVLRNVEFGGFDMPEAFEAREALRVELGVDDFGEWNDSRNDFKQVEYGVMCTVRALRARGR